MTITKIIIAFLVTATLSNCSSVKNLHEEPIGLINNISYKDSKFSNSNASNGFLVRLNKNNYAITAKHALMIAKTPEMKFVDFEGGLKQWKMHPKNDSTKCIVADELLNTNKKDSLTWSYMDTHWDTYNDWLVFSIKKNTTNHKPLKFRTKPLEAGEELYAVGWSYSDSTGTQRVYKYRFDETEGDYHTLTQVKGPKSLGGLSGSPIVDKKGELVGLVSSGWEDEETGNIILAATSTRNMLDFISELD